ncbi:terminase small subunit [Aminipila butyrica]|uniref:Terminase small subunit n=1 Tax=Aminipila butyrica TaxID=433296 RepID=A0A858BPU1_9FIRM|nr:terminase small subunit [Aminipila butyrica]QIB67813.1 terminase small subunit [Aminipila butyrica]
MILTEKQKRFIDYYIEIGNATEAAKKAGYNAKSDRAYQNIGSENLSKLGDLINEKLSEIASDRIAVATEIMEYLTAVMRREHKENIVVTIKEEQSKYVPDENGTMRKQTVKTEVPKTVEIPARLVDANKAAELLGKRYRLFTDNFDVNIESTQKFDDIISQIGGEGLDE